MSVHRRLLACLFVVACQPQERSVPPPPPPRSAPAIAPEPAPERAAGRTIEQRFAPPDGFTRVAVDHGGFGAYLRQLPLRAPGTAVETHDGKLLRPGDHPHVAAVADVALGPLDLQQCADSIIRLHAEWLLLEGRPDAIAYPSTSGQTMAWSRWAAGERGRLEGQRLAFATAARPDSSRRAFERYLDFVFSYAGTVSLAAYATPIDRKALAAGDFFVLPGGPGHSVLVLDLARDGGGRKVALLGQGFMPAQDFHVLRPRGKESPWFDLEVEAIDTPFWPEPFPWTSLRRFSSK
jgi:hypothetical protein